MPNHESEQQSAKNFLRVLGLAFGYKWTVGLALFCSVMVGLLWGSNIGAVYPFVEVLFRGHSLHDWADQNIEKAEARLAEIDDKIAAVESENEDGSVESDNRLAQLTSDRAVQQEALDYALWLRPKMHWLPEDPYMTLVGVIALMVIGTLLKDLFLMGNTLWVERVTQQVMMRLRMMFFRSTMRLDLATIGAHKQGELTSRFAFDMQTLANSIRGLFGRATVEPLKMVVCLGGAAFICWRLLVFSMMLAPVAIILIHFLARSIKRANRRAMEEMSRLVGQLSEAIDGIAVVKAFTMEEHERGRFREKAKEFYAKSMRIMFYASLTKPTTEMLGIGVISIAMLTGAYLVMYEQTHLFGIRMSYQVLTLPAMMAFFGLLAGVADPARKLAGVYNVVQPGIPAADRIFALINREPAISEPTEPRDPPSPHREIVFDDVRFAYATGGEVLSKVSLTIKHGETVAIVGPNGCGKSTLINLLPRFYDPTSGSVRIDHVDLKDIRIRSLRRRLGLVTQQAQLFDDTVLNNIRYGSLNATKEDVIEAAKQAHAHKFIEQELEAGYDTVIGPQGNRLSGGQRQRLALARAILRNPEILILDEATSQVDLESEHLIHQVLEKFVKNRTAIMITHRMSTLALADRILVMNNGQVEDLGTHEELIARCPLYQRLHEIQFRQIA